MQQIQRHAVISFIVRAASVLIVAIVSTATCHAQRPNIILLMGDDMGYTDIGCYGSEIETPVLDQLAHRGIRLTQFYNTSRCCPTRASLLTGLYSHQAGIGLMTEDLNHDGYRGNLNDRCVTLAEALGNTGYRTYMSGKWHVTRHIGPDSPNDNWPLQRGFDRFYGTIIGAGSFYDPTTLCRGNTFITPENDPEYQPESFYYTDAINENAVRYIHEHFDDQQSADDPFFMYVSYTSAHWPMHAPEELIQKYKGRYDAGYQEIRKARLEKAIELGMIDEKWTMSRPVSDWDTDEHKEWNLRCMEVYGAMVTRMDEGIGWIVDSLQERGQLENTLIIYIQDNGGCAEPFGREANPDEIANADYQPLGRDGLQTRIWPPMQTRGGQPVRTGPDVMPGAEDSFVAYGAGWANASNTPFRGFKHHSHEGGISSPMIVHWPGGIESENQNSIHHQPCHLIDIMPTLLEVAGGEYPESFNEREIQPMEGISLSPIFVGQPIERAEPIGFEHEGNAALRDGKWKLVCRYRRNGRTKWELYDMEADRTETENLAGTMPERRDAMIRQWQDWADRVGVLAWPVRKK